MRGPFYLRVALLLLVRAVQFAADSAVVQNPLVGCSVPAPQHVRSTRGNSAGQRIERSSWTPQHAVCSNGLFLGCVLRGGGRKARKRAKGTRDMIEAFEQMGAYREDGAERVKDGAVKRPVVAASRKLAISRMREDVSMMDANTLPKQPAQEQEDGGWIQVKRKQRLWGPCKLVVDGSNVLKHGGGAARLPRLLGAVEAGLMLRTCSEQEVLIVLDVGSTRELGEEGMKELGAFRWKVRVAPRGMPADVRVMQAAQEYKAHVLTNDRYIQYCPYRTKVSPTSGKLYVALGHHKGGVRLRSAHGITYMVSEDEWLWTYRHSLRFHHGSGGAWVVRESDDYRMQRAEQRRAEADAHPEDEEDEEDESAESERAHGSALAGELAKLMAHTSLSPLEEEEAGAEAPPTEPPGPPWGRGRVSERRRQKMQRTLLELHNTEAKTERARA